MTTTTTPDSQLRPATVADVLALYEPGPAVMKVTATATPLECIEQLSEAGDYFDAVQFLARWLTKREAIWWGALCVWHSARPGLRDVAQAVLQAIVQWVLEPSEEKRRTVRTLAGELRPAEPAAMLAMAVFTSGGSISRPNLPEVEPDADLAPGLVAKLLRVVATQVHGTRREDAYRQFLRLGLEIVAGPSHWEKSG